MYQRKSRQCCAAMLILSLVLRLSIALGLDSMAASAVIRAAGEPDFARWMLYQETGRVTQVTVPEPQPELWVLRMEAPVSDGEQPPAVSRTPEETVPLPTALASAGAITVAGACTYSYSKTDLLARPSSMDLSQDGPHILIIHSHGSEAYTPEPDRSYISSGSYRTLDAAQSVIRVGEVLCRTLEAGGIPVLHDTSVNDYPDYDSSYYNSLQRIQYWKEQYPSLQMVVDIHRDAAEDSSGQPLALSSSQNGESCAQLMLVVGTDQGGLAHPDWQENLANALKLQSVLEGMYPGLCRNLDLRTERFNQHMTPGSLLVEVGVTGNTLTQAERSAVLLGDAIVRMYNALRSNNGSLCIQAGE